MKRSFLISAFVLLAVSLMLIACNAQQASLKQLESFTQKIENKSAGWSEADWDDAAVEFSEITQTLERYEYSDAERRRIGELKGRCVAQFYKHSLENVGQGVNDAFIELGGAIEGLIEGLK